MSDQESSSAPSKRPHDDSDDEGSAKKRRGQDKIEIRFLIPYNTAGAIIGKGGVNIKELRQEYNANVQIPDSNGVERIITASTKTVEDAANLTGKIAEALGERLHQREGESTVKLLVHRSQAGTIIGLKGSRIKELRSTTGANIKVNQELCPQSTDRICQIKGSREVIVKSSKHILDLLQEAPPKGPVHNYDPDFYDDSYDYGGYNKYDRDGPMDRGRRGGFGRSGGYRGGGGYDDYGDYGGRGDYDQGRFGGGYGGYDDEGYDNYGDSYDRGYADDGGYGNEGQNYDDGEEKTTQVSIPTDLAGSIIGKGGNRIRQIRQDSGAQITIADPEPGSNDRIITIVGTDSQTQNAQYLLQKCVKMFSGGRY